MPYLHGSFSYGLICFVFIAVKMQHCFLIFLHHYPEIAKDGTVSLSKWKVLELNNRCGTSRQFPKKHGQVHLFI